MLEDKRLERKLLHLKDEYDKTESMTDSEKILYSILNDEEKQKKKKPLFHLPSVASIAAIILFGIFVGASSFLDLDGSESGNSELTTQDTGEESLLGSVVEEGQQHNLNVDSYYSNEDKEAPVKEIEKRKKLTKEELLLFKEEQQLKFEESMPDFVAKIKESSQITDENKLKHLEVFATLNALIREFNYKIDEAATSEEVMQIVDDYLYKRAILYDTRYVYEFKNEINNIKENYKIYTSRNYSEDFLKSLQPYEVMALYFYASSVGDYEAIYELYVKDSPYGFDYTREEYMEQERNSSKEQKERNIEGSKQMLNNIYMIEQLVKPTIRGIGHFEGIVYDEATIILYFNEDLMNMGHNMDHFTLATNQKGVWKVTPVPMQ
jgi:hypothetical protein